MQPDEVTVRVWSSSGAPVAGRAVAFLAPDDTPIAEVMTDATGAASAPMPDGGSVTIAAASTGTGGLRPKLYTYLDVKNGDVLDVGSPATTAPTTFDITVTVPAGAASTAQNFLFHSTCNLNAGNTTSSRQVTMKIRTGCTSADFYVEAQDASYRPISSLYVTGRAVSPGATIDVGSTFTPVVTSTFTVENAPSFSQITPALDLVVGDFYPVVAPFNSPITLTNGTGTKSLTHGSISGASLEKRVYIDDLRPQLYVTRNAAPDASTLDFDTADLPSLLDDGAWDATTSTVSWLEIGAVTNVATASLRIRGGADRDFVWMVVGPSSGGTLRFPTLPASLSEFAITPADDVTVAHVGIGALPGGYDRVRPLLLRVDDLSDSTAFFSPLQGSDRRNKLTYVSADGDVAMLASTN